MKKLLLLFLLVVLAAVALPVVNLVVGTPENALAAVKVLGRKCASCHTAAPALPFYAAFPVASSMIQADVDQGNRSLDLVAALAGGSAAPAAEVAMAKIEHVIARESMPPLRYLALHWDGSLGDDQKAELSAWITAAREKHHATPGVAAEFRHEPVQPLPKVIELDAVKVKLGRDLYHDTRLSGDDTVSCASCHDLKKGGTDQLRYSKGIRGQVGGINAPTTFNAGWQFAQFWDGRAPTLEEQAKGPVENPIEMGAKWPEVVAKLKRDDAFVKAFTAAYPSGVTVDNVAHAIAEYERSLVTSGGRFDRYLYGDANAITAEEKEGYRLFKAHGCATCHVGKILGGRSYEAMGLRTDYFEQRGKPTDADLGRFSVTRKETDRHRFKVPTLRCLAATAPYLHDGSTSDLAEVVRTMGRCELDVTLSDQDVDLIVRFLKTLDGKLPE